MGIFLGESQRDIRDIRKGKLEKFTEFSHEDVSKITSKISFSTLYNKAFIFF